MCLGRGKETVSISSHFIRLSPSLTPWIGRCCYQACSSRLLDRSLAVLLNLETGKARSSKIRPARFPLEVFTRNLLAADLRTQATVSLYAQGRRRARGDRWPKTQGFQLISPIRTVLSAHLRAPSFRLRLQQSSTTTISVRGEVQSPTPSMNRTAQ